MRIFNSVNFEILIYIILSKNTRSPIFKKKTKKTELVLFPGHILPCKQNNLLYITLYITNSHVSDGGEKPSPWHMKAVAANRRLKSGHGYTSAALIVCPTMGRRHQLVA